jgi:hypothetical protein
VIAPIAEFLYSREQFNHRTRKALTVSTDCTAGWPLRVSSTRCGPWYLLTVTWRPRIVVDAEKPVAIMEFEMSHPSAEDALETGKREVTSALSNAHGLKAPIAFVAWVDP